MYSNSYCYNKSEMKILQYVLIIILFCFLKTSKAASSYVEEGLCYVVPKECDQSLQKKGVCCKGPNDDRLIYFPNSCLACMYVIIFRCRTARVTIWKQGVAQLVMIMFFKIFEYLA